MDNFMDFLVETRDKKNPLRVATCIPQCPTGFMYLDYGNGSYLNVYDLNERPLYTYHNIGIPAGSVNVVISKSQGGKTTLLIEMAMAIIAPYIQDFLYRDVIKGITPPKTKMPVQEGMPFMQILDTEKTLPIDYVKSLTRYRNRELRQCVAINPITTDKDLIAAVEKHIKFKVERMSPTIMPLLDIFGAPIWEYPPTVIIVDSMSQLLLEEVDDPAVIKAGKKGSLQDLYESATKGPAGAQRAKTVSALYSQLVNYAKRYNIIFFSINHINKMPAIMGIPVKQYRGLRPGETIGGGERAIYLASNILRLDVIKNIGGKSASSIQLGDGVTGHVAIASWIKSKSNSKSNSCQLVYTGDGGYNQLLSSLWYGKELGTLAKSGNYYYLNRYPDIKFTMKNYADVFADHPELFAAYYDQLRDECANMLDNPERALKHDQKMLEQLREDIHNDEDYSHSDIMDMDDMFAELINS